MSAAEFSWQTERSEALRGGHGDGDRLRGCTRGVEEWHRSPLFLLLAVVLRTRPVDESSFLREYLRVCLKTVGSGRVAWSWSRSSRCEPWLRGGGVWFRSRARSGGAC